MKTLMTLLFLSITLFSCSNSNSTLPDSQHFEYDGGIWSNMDYRIEEKTIDSCEYIIIFGVQSRNIIHKANCKNH